MVVDLGAGDGQAILARARGEPASLVLGVDASRRRHGRVISAPIGAVRPMRFFLAGAETLADTVLAVGRTS